MITMENTAGVLFVNVALFGIYLEHIKMRPECLLRHFSKKKKKQQTKEKTNLYIIAFGLYLTEVYINFSKSKGSFCMYHCLHTASSLVIYLIESCVNKV